MKLSPSWTFTLQTEIMTTQSRPPPKNIVLDTKQTVVTNILKISARGLNVFMKKRIPEWTKNRKYVKILVICGFHGNPNGTMDQQAEANDFREMKVRKV